MISFFAIATFGAAVIVTSLLLCIAAWRVRTGRARAPTAVAMSSGKAFGSSLVCVGFAMIGVYALAKGFDTGSLPLPRKGHVTSDQTGVFWTLCLVYFAMSVVMLLLSAGPHFARWVRRYGR